jgi:hypothetical protein
VKQLETLEASDLDALLELEQHAGYTLMQDRIWQTIEQKRNDLERETDPGRLAQRQGEIAGLRLALNVPGILKAEIKTAVEQG